MARVAVSMACRSVNVAEIDYHPHSHCERSEVISFHIHTQGDRMSAEVEA